MQHISQWELRTNSRIDLHMHSTRSDGRYEPEEVLQRCADGRLDLVAITDHDLTPHGLAGPQQVGDRTVWVLNGAEVSGVYEGTELHLLVYFPGPVPQGFTDFCRQRARQRAERYETGRARMGLEGVPPADAQARAGERSLTRLHLARSLVEAGHVANIREAFSRWTGDDSGMVPPVELEFIEAIAVARANGGVTSWAHPPVQLAEKWTKTFARAGLHGLEGIRPGTGRRYRKVMQGLSRKHGLMLTGGSDWHGWRTQRLGDFALDHQQARGLLRALLAA